MTPERKTEIEKASKLIGAILVEYNLRIEILNQLNLKPMEEVKNETVNEELPKVVDEQMLEENPELKEAGVEVGAEISETSEEVAEVTPEEVPAA